MVISNAAGSRPVYQRGSAGSAAMQSMVPGDHPGTEEDLAAFPQPVLDLLARYGTRVAILKPGQTLVQSEALPTLSPAQVAAEARRTNTLVKEGVARIFPEGVNTYPQLEAGAEQLTRDLRLAGLDYHLGIALNPFPTEALAEAREVPAAHLREWTQAFATLNEGLADTTPDGVQAKSGLVVIPHTYHNGAAVPELRLRNAGDVTAEWLEGKLGINRSDEKLVLLHDKFLGSPAAELGNYRVSIHEMGHALDHVLDQLTNFPGFGALHRETVDAMFAADKARVEAGAAEDAVFTSDRADDDVREYFAEAVEAYLTPAKADGHDHFRAGNSREGLAAKNPELFAYVEKVMTTEFPSSAVPEEPHRSLTPPGIPDPDLEVVRLS